MKKKITPKNDPESISGIMPISNHTCYGTHILSLQIKPNTGFHRILCNNFTDKKEICIHEKINLVLSYVSGQNGICEKQWLEPKHSFQSML